MKIEIQKSAAAIRRFFCRKHSYHKTLLPRRSYDTHGIADLPPFI